jgi:hypothetical protein
VTAIAISSKIDNPPSTKVQMRVEACERKFETYLMQETIFRLSSTVDAASRHLWTAQLPNLYVRERKLVFFMFQMIKLLIPMCHHFESTCADSVHDLGSLVKISNFEFLLQKDRRLLVG